MSDVALQLKGVSKFYGATTALDNVSVAVKAGAIHGLVGENGAGKSTLGKIVGGIVRPDRGTLEVGGRDVQYRSPRDAIEDGVAVMGQEIALVPAMSVFKNVFLGAEKRQSDSGESQTDLYRSLTERIGFGPKASARVDSLSISEQQRVQILRALARDATILVMDEPTSSQHREELRKLHHLLSELRNDGITIIYVSHFLDDVLDLADDVTILRSGKLVDQVKASETDADGLLRSMLGKRLEAVFPQRQRGLKDGPVALEVEGLSRDGVLHDVNLNVRRGEIVGLSGLVGSGRTELARSIFGVDRYDSGTVAVHGTQLKGNSTPAAIRAGLALVPEDRKMQGLLSNISQEANIILPHLDRFSTMGVVRRGAERDGALQYATQTGVTPMQLETVPDTLSGGNQQKVLFAKWLCGEPSVLILDEPTRGVDVGAKSAIYHLIARLADEHGLAVLMISSELEEITELSDRILVLHEGSITAEFEASDGVDGEEVMRAAFGYSTERSSDKDVNGAPASG